MEKLAISSPVFENDKSIPKKYTCDGDDVNPSINIAGIPEGTKSLVLIVDDPDAPMGTRTTGSSGTFPRQKNIEENAVPGVEGLNDFRRHSYGGPCPPSGTHRYFFKVYALNTKLDLSSDSNKRDVEKAMKDHILAQSELVGFTADVSNALTYYLLSNCFGQVYL